MIIKLHGVVRAWIGKGGVVVRFGDGEMVKVKSRWWFRSGFTGQRRQDAAEWEGQEQGRRRAMESRLKLKSQRMAIVGCAGAARVLDVFRKFELALKVEMVYNAVNGRLRVVIVSFGSVEHCERSMQDLVVGKLQCNYAYSNRTCVGAGMRVETFWRDMVL